MDKIRLEKYILKSENGSKMVVYEGLVDSKQEIDFLPDQIELNHPEVPEIDPD